PREQWDTLVSRPQLDTTRLFDTVGAILDDIRQRGDAAVKEYSAKFDNVDIHQELLVSEVEKDAANTAVPDELKQAIYTAKANIEKFHSAQKFQSGKIETSSGVTCWQRQTPIERVGLYIPGGTAPLFSTVLMLAIPAKIAGCSEIVLCSPPTVEGGKIHPAVIFAATVAGVNKIFKIGGVQAIGAMAVGTESVPRVYKIFGPGNQYVTAAKQLASMKDVAIDMPAGPSEVEVIADETAYPAFVAADLLSQAEHGPDSQAIMLTTSVAVADAVKHEVKTQLTALSRRKIAEKALQNSRLIVLKNIDEIIDFTNHYAPEHLIIATKNYSVIADRIINAGSVFLGNYSPESAGDYASGTNHTLPTHGWATAFSGVNLDSFLKKITFQELTQDGLRHIGPAIEIMAAAEHLDAHRNAVSLRM
ncbi:MAG: histidinol dehydrogenase, partial [Tannerella sp.]|nr:histidinol dehydrogenase [Tannerella sp.]